MFDYGSLGADAAGLIEEFGAAAVLKRSVAGDYDPRFGDVDDNGLQVFNTVAVRVEYELSDVDGTQIRAGDVKLLVTPDLATTPQSGDTIEFAGDTYTVVVSTPLSPAGVVVLHQVQARNA